MVGQPVEDRFFRLLVESAVDAFVCAGPDGVIRVWNGAAETLLGYTREEAVGKTLDLVLPDRECRERHWKAFRRWFDTGENRISQPFGVIPLIHKDGHELELESTFVRIRDEAGRPAGAGAILRPAGLSSAR